MCFVFSLCFDIFASDVDFAHAPDLYDASRMEDIAQLKTEIENAEYEDNAGSISADPCIAYPIVKHNELDVPLYMQNTKYYCGPASVQMVLAYLGENVTQDTLAQQMNTQSSGGTYVYKIRDCLNNYLGSGTYKYVLTSEISFVNGMKYSIDKNFPVICHIRTGALPIYNGRDSGHYVVTTGYFSVEHNPNGIEDTKTIYYNDPHYNTAYYGAHTCTYTEMTNAINQNAGYYIMGA